MDFLCKSKKCAEDDQPYVVHIPLEVYEQHNMATLYCPNCGCELEENCEADENETV